MKSMKYPSSGTAVIDITATIEKQKYIILGKLAFHT